ncbi:MAG: hypothetical protein J6C90_01255 [Clostridia bacterium]|nr:hypothetical protein [Clostridia bacterium]
MNKDISVKEVSDVARINNMMNALRDKYYLPLKARTNSLLDKGKSLIHTCSLHKLTSRTK